MSHCAGSSVLAPCADGLGKSMAHRRAEIDESALTLLTVNALPFQLGRKTIATTLSNQQPVRRGRFTSREDVQQRLTAFTTEIGFRKRIEAITQQSAQIAKGSLKRR